MSGDQAPGFPAGCRFKDPGSTKNTFFELRTNERGDIAFMAAVTGGGHGIWTGRPGNLRLVVGTGMPVPGARTKAGKPVTFKGADRNFHLDESGRVTFVGRAVNGPGGIWRYDENGLRRIVQRIKGAKKMGLLHQSMPCYEQQPCYVAGRQGELAVLAANPRSRKQSAIWFGAGVELKPVVKVGDPAPGMKSERLVFDSLKPKSVSGRRVLFEGTVSGPGLSGNTLLGLWLAEPDGIRSVAWINGPAPGGGEFSRFVGPLMRPGTTGTVTMNAEGVVAFAASTTTGVIGVWTGKPGGLRLAKRADEEPVATEHTDGNILLPHILEDGRLLLASGGGLLHGETNRLMCNPAMGITPGSVIAAPGLVGSAIPRGTVGWSQPSGVAGHAITRDGIMAYHGALDSTRTAIWIGHPHAMRLVVCGSDSVTVAPDDTRQITANGIYCPGPGMHSYAGGHTPELFAWKTQSPLSDSGILLMQFTFKPEVGVRDKTRGLFSLDVKELLENSNVLSADNLEPASNTDVINPWESE